jgi:hypothetical protein
VKVQKERLPAGWLSCNPSYSDGRDQEDHSSKPALGKQFERPYLEKQNHKKGLVEWLKV